MARLEYWRRLFRFANDDIFHVIEKAIEVAAADYPDQFLARRDRIAETLYKQYCVGSDLSCETEEREDEDVDGVEEEAPKEEVEEEESDEAAEALTEEMEQGTKQRQPPHAQEPAVAPQQPQSEESRPRLLIRIKIPRRLRESTAAAPSQEEIKASEEASFRTKMEVAKRKLQESYQRAANTKKQRMTRLVELHDLPEQGRNTNQQVPSNAKHRSGIRRNLASSTTRRR